MNDLDLRMGLNANLVDEDKAPLKIGALSLAVDNNNLYFDALLKNLDGSENLKRKLITSGQTYGIRYNDDGSSYEFNKKQDSTLGRYALALGKDTISEGQYSLSTGYSTEALGYCSYASGNHTKAVGKYSYVSGNGRKNIALDLSKVTINGGNSLRISSDVVNYPAFMIFQPGNILYFFYKNIESGVTEYVEVKITNYKNNVITTDKSYALDPSMDPLSYQLESIEIYPFGKAHGECDHSEGISVTKGYCAHAEGYLTNAGMTSDGNLSTGFGAHAEGYDTSARGSGAHAEGYSCVATQDGAHAEGYDTIARGIASHAEGYNTEAIGVYSHAGGSSSKAEGRYSFASGYGLKSIWDNTTVFGKYNWYDHSYKVASFSSINITSGDISFIYADDVTIDYDNCVFNIAKIDKVEASSSLMSYSNIFIMGLKNYKYILRGNYLDQENFSVTSIYQIDSVTKGNTGFVVSVTELAFEKNQTYAFIIGNGNRDTDRSNAFTVKWDGNTYISGNLYVNSSNDLSQGSQVATESYVTNIQSSLNGEITTIKGSLSTLDTKVTGLGTSLNETKTSLNQTITDKYNAAIKYTDDTKTAIMTQVEDITSKIVTDVWKSGTTPPKSPKLLWINTDTSSGNGVLYYYTGAAGDDASLQANRSKWKPLSAIYT